jgi:hypothetical protein
MTDQDVLEAATTLRQQLKLLAENVLALKAGTSGEACANATLAYRHLEDASMRLGKTIQAIDGGVSVYDRRTTVGA